jgi:predicted signal transduction protein with EAL and GGDEF domain
MQLRWPLVIDTSLLHIATIAYLTAIALDEIDFRILLGRIAESRFHRIAMSLGDGLDGLKIDGSFVLDLLADSDDAAIVSSTVGLSKQLGLSVIAEGIENRATADFLVGMGCEEGQGYFFGKPMPARELETQFMAAYEIAAAG